MDMEVSKKDLPNPKVKQDNNTLFTTGLILEISVDTAQQSKYDMIIGRNLQLALGMNILFSTKQLKWDGIMIPTHTPNAKFVLSGDTNEKYWQSPGCFATASTPMSIVDAKYEKANIDATINSLKHLSNNQQQQLKALLYNLSIYLMERLVTGKQIQLALSVRKVLNPSN
jgi:hypothetical protein